MKLRSRHLTSRASQVLALLVLLSSGAIVYAVLQPPLFTSWDLRNNLWAPAYLLVHGQSPYQIQVIFPDAAAIWFPMAIGVFAPLGWLDQYQATSIWLLVNIVMLGAIVWLVWDRGQPPPLLLGVMLVLVFLFPPSLSHLYLGQFTITVAVSLIGAAKYSDSRIWVSGFLCAIALTKPQLCILVLPGLMLIFMRMAFPKAVLSFVGAFILASVGLTMPLWGSSWQWLGEFVTAIRSNPTWLQPSLFTELQLNFGFYGLLGWGLVAIGLLALNEWLWFKLPAKEAIVWSLALTTLVSPYVWSWDFVLLLPLFVNTFSHLETVAARGLLGLGYMLCWGLSFWVRLRADYSDEQLWWMPLLMLAAIGGAYVFEAAQTRTVSRIRLRVS